MNTFEINRNYTNINSIDINSINANINHTNTKHTDINSISANTNHTDTIHTNHDIITNTNNSIITKCTKYCYNCDCNKISNLLCKIIIFLVIAFILVCSIIMPFLETNIIPQDSFKYHKYHHNHSPKHHHICTTAGEGGISCTDDDSTNDDSSSPMRATIITFASFGYIFWLIQFILLCNYIRDYIKYYRSIPKINTTRQTV